MQIFRHAEQPVPDIARGVALGFFDGIHHGHLELLRTLLFHCDRLDLVSSVLTFPQHPAELVQGESGFSGYLSSLDERLKLMAGCGMEETHLQAFDQVFAALEPDAFLNIWLGQRLNARLIVVGEDYHYGRNRRGDINSLKEWAAKRSIEVIVVPPVRMYGQKVSSSAIREAVISGDLEAAARLLGRTYQISGPVISGRKIGRKMGFPTANLRVPADRVCPAYGVYATRTIVSGRSYESVTNIGIRPTIEQVDDLPLIETYLYDTTIDLYGQVITVEFLWRLRPEEKFSSMLRLSNRINQDLQDIRKWHTEHEEMACLNTVGDIPFYWLSTNRFARSLASLVFRMPADRRQTTADALLINVLTACCRRYPSRPQLAAALDHLYGASIDAHLDRQGDMQSIMLTVSALHQWTDQSSPFHDAIDVMFDLLLHPLMDQDGCFDREIVESERNNLRMEWLARENDRGKFAYDRCVELLSGDQRHGISSLGDRDLLAKITQEDLKRSYQRLLSGSQVTCYVAGQRQPLVRRMIEERLARLPVVQRPVYTPGSCPRSFTPQPMETVQEYKDVAQARIIMAYQGLPPYFSFQTLLTSVMNNMLGGDVYSLLFDTVREKMGLAYHVFSMNQRYLSMTFLMAGVAPEQVNAACEAMHAQVEKMASGDFSDQLLKRALQMTETSIRSSGDDLGSMLQRQIAGMAHGRTLGTADMLSMLTGIGREDIRQIAACLKPSGIYLLNRAAVDRPHGNDRQEDQDDSQHND